MHIPSNMSSDTFFMYHCTDENAVEFYTEARDKINSLEKRLCSLGGYLERAEEQVSFAQDLVDRIEKALGYTRAKEMREAIRNAIEESMFER